MTFQHTLHGFAAVFLLAGAAAAQASLSFANGVLGEQVHFNFDGGGAFQVLGIAPSLQDTVTPLSLFDPGDPRSLDVGIDLISIWGLGLLDDQGSGAFAYPLPADASLSGVTLFAQGITAPGATTLVDEVTERVEYTLALKGEAVYTLGPPVRARRHHAATSLFDGSIVLTGGMDPATIGAPVPTVFADGEVFEHGTSTFGSTFPLAQARALHSATLLADGRVLLLGGVGPSGNAIASGEIFDPATGASTATQPMAGPRVLHSATLLDDGRVLVVGGSAAYTASHPIGYPASTQQAALTMTEIYDPVLDAWSAGPLLAKGRTAHDAQLLPDGTVLISGGLRFVGQVKTTASCILIDPVGGTAQPTASLPEPRAFHDGVVTHDGRVLVAGGADIELGQLTATGILPTALYSLATEATAAWTPGALIPGIVIGGDTRCICKKIVVVTLPGPDDGGTVTCIPEDIIYGISGGIGALDLPSGAANPQDACYVSGSSLSSWSTSNIGLVARPDSTTTVTNDGARMLTSGAADTGPPTAELWMLDG